MWTISELAGRAGRRIVGPAIALLVLAGVPVGARAGDVVVPQQSGVAPVASLFKRVQADFPGDILTVQLKMSDTPVYRVKLLTTAGDVLLLAYDAGTLHLESVAGHLAGAGQDAAEASSGNDKGHDDNDGRDDDGNDGHDGGDDGGNDD